MFIPENEFQNVVCKMAAVLDRPQHVKYFMIRSIIDNRYSRRLKTNMMQYKCLSHIFRFVLCPLTTIRYVFPIFRYIHKTFVFWLEFLFFSKGQIIIENKSIQPIISINDDTIHDAYIR